MNMVSGSLKSEADFEALLKEIEAGGEYIVSDIGRKLYNKIAKESQIL